MNRLMLVASGVLAIGWVLTASANAVADDAFGSFGRYDPGSGNLQVEFHRYWIGIDIKSASGALIEANGNDLGVNYNTSLAPNGLSWLNFGGFAGSLDLGDIVTPGTPANDLSLDVVPAFGLSIALCIVAVPEPSTLLQVCLMSATFLAASRWRLGTQGGQTRSIGMTRIPTLCVLILAASAELTLAAPLPSG